MNSCPIYKPVNALSRGLAILRALNQAEGGWASIRELSEATGLHRTTARRMLETLQSEGLVRRSLSDDSYRLMINVRELSEGFSDDEWISNVAAPVLGELLQNVVWPSDLTTLDGDAMIIRETTHRYSPLSFHRSMVRVRMPLLTTASGRAFLAFSSPEDRGAALDLVERNQGAPLDRAAIERQLDAFRKRGYAANMGEWRQEQRIFALAMPIFHRGKVAACINIVMLKKAVTLTAAREKYLEPLQAATRKIESYLQAHDPTGLESRQGV